MLLSIVCDKLERSVAWGRVSSVMNYVYRPTTVEGMREVFDLGHNIGLSVGMRGAGRSYGDAAINGEQLLLDLSAMNRIISWDAKQGIIVVEPGVTVEQLWKHVINDGWWPPVVPGTMHATLGGCASMNIHGKNQWQDGNLGDHIVGFTFLLPTGEVIECSRGKNSEMFFSCIGAFGMLGCFTSITIRMKHIHSGLLQVAGLAFSSLESMLDFMDEIKDEVDYLVGWVDGLVSARMLGRGQVHTATHLARGEDQSPEISLDLKSQRLPDKLLGVVPRKVMWRITKPFVNEFGIRYVNAGKYLSARIGNGRAFKQSLAAFNFLLDYIPDWEKSYLPGGLIQYQSFIDRRLAAGTFYELLECCKAHNIVPMLCVVKRHRPDKFLVSCGLDGFSLAIDFRVTEGNRKHLVQLAKQMDKIVLSAGGRFYLAKDSTLHPDTAHSYLGNQTISRIAELKQRCDPAGLLQSNLSRRVLPDLHFPDREHIA